MDNAKRTAPEIRFPGFTDPWEQRKLGELSEIKDSARIPNDEWCESGVPYIRASDISNEDASGVLFISQERYSYYKSKTGAPAKGDVLFNGGGEIGKAMLNNTDNPVYVQGGAVLYARTSASINLDGQYLKTYFETSSAQHYFDTASAGGTMKHFTLKPSQEMPISYPKINEQKQIGQFFEQIDNTITLHQRKCDELKNFKKGLLQQLFPLPGESIPRVRFPGFTAPWEQRKLGDEFIRVNERNDGSFGKEHWISVAKMYYQDPEKVQSNNLDTRTYVMRLGDIAFEGHPNSEYKFGRFVANDIGDGIISELFPIYRHKLPFDNNYWKYAIQIERVMSPIYAKAITSSGASSNKLNEEHFLRESICVPSLDEQSTIGSFFKLIDNTITLHQRKCDELKEYKKGLLQKMFV